MTTAPTEFEQSIVAITRAMSPLAQENLAGHLLTTLTDDKAIDAGIAALQIALHRRTPEEQVRQILKLAARGDTPEPVRSKLCYKALDIDLESSRRVDVLHQALRSDTWGNKLATYLAMALVVNLQQLPPEKHTGLDLARPVYQDAVGADVQLMATSLEAAQIKKTPEASPRGEQYAALLDRLGDVVMASPLVKQPWEDFLADGCADLEPSLKIAFYRAILENSDQLAVQEVVVGPIINTLNDESLSKHQCSELALSVLRVSNATPYLKEYASNIAINAANDLNPAQKLRVSQAVIDTTTNRTVLRRAKKLRGIARRPEFIRQFGQSLVGHPV